MSEGVLMQRKHGAHAYHRPVQGGHLSGQCFDYLHLLDFRPVRAIEDSYRGGGHARRLFLGESLRALLLLLSSAHATHDYLPMRKAGLEPATA